MRRREEVGRFTVLAFVFLIGIAISFVYGVKSCLLPVENALAPRKVDAERDHVHQLAQQDADRDIFVTPGFVPKEPVIMVTGGVDGEPLRWYQFSLVRQRWEQFEPVWNERPGKAEEEE